MPDPRNQEASLARWDHAKWLQTRLGEARQRIAELEARERAYRKALEDQRRRWNRHSTQLTMAGVNASGRDMDDAVNAIDAALAANPSEEEA